MQKQVLLAFLLFTLLGTFAAKSCQRINIASNSSKYSDDMVSHGYTSAKWSENSTNPIIIGPTKAIDYIYVIVDEPTATLSVSNMMLDFDNKQYANSKLSVDISEQSGKTEYAVEIKYHCNDIGGALINYKLTIDYPGCGQADVNWKKLCGNPITPREGFMIALNDGKTNKTIVRDGKVVDSQNFDADIDNYVYKVPGSTNRTVFYLYMDQKKQESAKTNTVDEDEQIIEALRDMIRMVPETKISKPKVDTDETILEPILGGKASQGGYIGSEPMELVLNYYCETRTATAVIELTIPLDYFKDITLFFQKDCNNAVIDNYVHYGFFGVIFSLIYWIIVLTIVVSLFIGALNVYQNGTSWQDGIPGFNALMRYIANNQYIENSWIGSKLASFKDYRFHVTEQYSSNKMQDEETEFKIENLEEIQNQGSSSKTGYGSI